MGASSDQDYGLLEAWDAYKDRLKSDFEPYESQLINTEQLLLVEPVFPDDDAVLDGLASASERLEERIVVARWHAVPSSGTALRWEEFAAAVAALDLHLAGSLLRLTIGRDEWQTLIDSSAPDPEWLDTLLAHAKEDLAGGITTLTELIDAADAALGLIMAGGQDSPTHQLRTLIEETIEELMTTARRPVVKLVSTLPNVISPFFVHGAFDIVTGNPFAGASVPLTARGPFTAAGRFVKTGLRKLLSAAGVTPEQLVSGLAGLLGDTLTTRLAELRADSVDLALGKIVRREECQQRVEAVLTDAGDDREVLDQAYVNLDGAFIPLRFSYRDQQRHTEGLAKGVRLLAPFVTLIAPPAGPAIVVGTVLVGVSYPLIGLADRLDATSFVLFNRIEGIPTLVEKHLPRQTPDTDAHETA